MALDGGSWLAAFVVGTVFRLGVVSVEVPWRELLILVVATIVVHAAVGRATRLYDGRFPIGSLNDAVGLFRTWVATIPFVLLLNYVVLSRPVPSLAMVAALALALLQMVGGRIVWRLANDRRFNVKPTRPGRRVIVVGAGEGGEQIIRSMRRDPGQLYEPVGIVDDSPRKAKRVLDGVPVLGTRDDIERLATELSADVLLIAIPSAGTDLIGELSDIGSRAGLDVKILPSTHEILGMLGINDIREVTEAELLGRHEVEVDIDSIARYVTGRRVLVTGAGGSIGSELSRQLSALEPSELMLLDRDETALHGLQLSMDGRALLDSPNLIVADIRDRDRMLEIFEHRRPEVVFHTAALKHLTLLEQNPDEGAKTNVLGTRNLLEAARATGVDHFVNVSTDKAANPTSVLGSTKRVAECLTATMAQETSLPYVSVRFGNVLGSRGSVLPTFRSQIAAGGPVTVTDAEATRYFMTIPEAVRLVLQAGAIGRPGEIMILDMGEPVRIIDMARRLIQHMDPSVEIEITGLRSGEKKDEILIGNDEIAVVREHERVMHAVGQPIAAEMLSLVDLDDARGLTAALSMSDARSVALVGGPSSGPGGSETSTPSRPSSPSMPSQALPSEGSDRIFLSAPDVRGREIELVTDSIESNWLAPVGPHLDAFEKEVAERCGTKHAVALSSGTAALHLALMEAGVGAGDEVLCASFTFAGSANPICYLGAKPVFIDSERTSWNIDPALVEVELKAAAKRGKLPAAVLAVDLYGATADYTALTQLCGEYGVPIIEDAAEALGSRHDLGPAGSLGQSGIVSFNGNKIVTASGGGALVTDSDEIAQRVRYLATQAKQPVRHYEHVEVGFNYRMSNVMAAVGRAQLETLDERIAERKAVSQFYREIFDGVSGVEFLVPPPWGDSNHWLTCLTLDENAPIDRDGLIDQLELANIESRPVWKPMHLQPVFASERAQLTGVSEWIFERGVCLPSGSGMSSADFERISTVISRCLR